MSDPMMSYHQVVVWIAERVCASGHTCGDERNERCYNAKNFAKHRALYGARWWRIGRPRPGRTILTCRLAVGLLF